MNSERRNRAIGLLFLSLAASACFGQSQEATPESKGIPFELSFGGVSPIAISQFQNATTANAALAVRTFAEVDQVHHLRFEGSAKTGWLEQYEVTWPIYYTPSGNRAQVNNRYPQATLSS